MTYVPLVDKKSRAGMYIDFAEVRNGSWELPRGRAAECQRLHISCRIASGRFQRQVR